MTDTTKSTLLAAAVDLFAAGGIDGPSMREITRAAGQRNTAALQYHFGGRAELVAALLDQFGEPMDREREALLDQIEAGSTGDLRALALALVLPLVSRLSDGDGPYFLQVAGEVVARPRRFADVLEHLTMRPSLRRWGDLIEPFLPPGSIGPPLHRRFATIRFAHVELASRARDGASSDHRLFANHLADLVCGLLAAPVNPATASLVRPCP
jgi:AcrR family transcriptional regulator